MEVPTAAIDAELLGLLDQLAVVDRESLPALVQEGVATIAGHVYSLASGATWNLAYVDGIVDGLSLALDPESDRELLEHTLEQERRRWVESSADVLADQLDLLTAKIRRLQAEE